MPGFQFRDIEADLISYLTNKFPTVIVRNQVPTERGTDTWPKHGRLIVVRDDGGWANGDDGGLRATRSVGVRIWAPTKAECTDLASEVTARLNAWPNRLVKAGLSRPVSEESGRIARYLTASITERGTQIHPN